jgi:putative heme iron utilization protein
MADDGWLTDDVVAAVIAHMNGDHADDNVVICRGAGGRPDTTAARMTGVDTEGIEFSASTPQGDVAVRVAFAKPVTERAQIRAEVAQLFHDSAAIVTDHR